MEHTCNTNGKKYMLISILLAMIIAAMFMHASGICRPGGNINRLVDRFYPATETVAAVPTIQAELPRAATPELDVIDGAVEHIVRRGETLFTIAERLTGNGRNFRAIAAFNNIDPNDVEVGDIIRIPAELIRR